MMWIAASQPPFLAAVLAWSGVVKLARTQVAGTALHRLLGGRLAVPAFRAVGAVEVALAVALLAIPGRAAPMAAAALATGFLCYLTYAAIATPQASCGCLGSARTPVSWRSFARAGLLLAAALAAAVPGAARWSAMRTAGTGAVLAAEAAVFVALSAELDRFWLVPLRKLRARLTHPLAGAPDVVPLHATITQLQRSEAYRQAAPLLASDIREHWDADEWRILCFAARYNDQPATAVFAVPLLRDDPAAIRMSIVDEEAAAWAEANGEAVLDALEAPPVS